MGTSYEMYVGVPLQLIVTDFHAMQQYQDVMQKHARNTEDLKAQVCTHLHSRQLHWCSHPILIVRVDVSKMRSRLLQCVFCKAAPVWRG